MLPRVLQFRTNDPGTTRPLEQPHKRAARVLLGWIKAADASAAETPRFGRLFLRLTITLGGDGRAGKDTLIVQTGDRVLRSRRGTMHRDYGLCLILPVELQQCPRQGELDKIALCAAAADSGMVGHR